MWIVIDCLMEPSTGTVFSWIISANKMHLILWHSGNVQFLPGDKINNIPGRISTTTVHENQQIFHIIAFKPALWSMLIRNLKCPKNNKIFTVCPEICRIAVCSHKRQ